jgi:hypothetical protein
MDLLWTALGISVIVVFVFYVLAQHWQRILRQQTWTIRRLTERLRDLEEVADPEFLRRLNDAAPSPLEQVFTFSFRLSDTFWRDTLHIPEGELHRIRAPGSFPGSVKVERWRGHTVAAITEVLPESKLAGWQTRSLDLYPDGTKEADFVTLWEIPLARARKATERPPSLELVFHSNSLELRGQVRSVASGNGHGANAEENEVVFFRVPLDALRLAEFCSNNPSRPFNDGNGNSNADTPGNGAAWQGLYTHEDEGMGFEWQLWIRDLCKKTEWERWKILESTPVSVLPGEK